MSNVNQPPFSPSGPTVNVTAGTTTGNVQFQTNQTSQNVRVYNSGASVAFINFGPANTIAATLAAGMPIAPGTVEVFSCPHPYVACITTSGSSVLYLTPGHGQ